MESDKPAKWPRRIVSLSTEERHGGAARAASRIHSGYREQGCQVTMYVQRRQSTEPDVIATGSGVAARWRSIRDRWRLWIGGRRHALFSACAAGGCDPRHPAIGSAEAVHLHWVANGFVGVGQVARFPAPVVWTLHDMWAFTGGCFYSGGCRRFEGSCGFCPILGSRRDADWSRAIHATKVQEWEGSRFAVVTPSHWLGEEARRSSLLGLRRIQVIANGLDLKLFRPGDRERARGHLGISLESKVLVFSAMSASSDPRKGFDRLLQVLARLLRTHGDVVMLVMGADGPGDDDAPVLANCRFLGTLDDEADIVQAYVAADLQLFPSRCDNLSNALVEAAACGCPSVAFDVGGNRDVVVDGISGRLVMDDDVDAMADAAAGLLDAEPGEACSLRAATRAFAESRFCHRRQAAAYLDLFAELAEEERAA